MKALFVATFVSGLLYFLALRRGVDFYTLAFVAAAIYFTPGLAGFDILGDPLEPETYGVFLLVLGGLLAAGVARPPRPHRPVRALYGYAPQLAAALSVAAILYVLAKSGVGMLFVPKLQQEFPIAGWIAWRVLASLALLYGVLTRRRGVLLCGAAGLLLMFLASDRTAVAMAASAAALEIVGRRQGVPPLRAARRFILPLAVAVVLVWGGKIMHIAIRESVRRHDFSKVSTLVRDPRALRLLTVNSEPFLTQALLNQSVRQELYIGPGHLVGVAYQLWPAPSMFGHPSREFNDLVEQRLIPGATRHSTAYNFWAEAMVSGGWLLLVLFLALFLAGLEAANAAAR
ncbi:MAG: hypothetical protein ACJ8GN_30740, partial [Longimicrobiaceae bacterium]